jgi:hypothetical protein
VVARGREQEGGRDEQIKHRGFGGSEIVLGDVIMVDTCHDTFVKTQRMYSTKSEPQHKL